MPTDKPALTLQQIKKASERAPNKTVAGSGSSKKINKTIRYQKVLFLLDYAVALFFPQIPKLVVVIYGLKNRRISQLLLQPTFA